MYTLKENMKRFNTKNLNEQGNEFFGDTGERVDGKSQADIISANDQKERFGNGQWGMEAVTKDGRVEINNFEDVVAAIPNMESINKQELLYALDEVMPGIMELCKLV